MKLFFQSVLKHIDKLSDEKLREQYRLVTDEVSFLETVLEALKEAVVVFDANGEITYKNHAAEELPDFDLPLGKASKNEITVSYPDEKVYDVQTIPFERGTLAIARDITAEKERTRSELESGATKSVCELAAGVAHEIGNPLNAIALNIQMIERDPTDTESIEICKQQILRLDGIIRGFLTALRPERLNLRAESIAQPLKNCLRALKQQFEERRIKVTLDIPSSLPAVAIDSDRMEQVFFNLIKNAMEAMKDSGSIDIDLGSDDKDVTVSFRDTGTGMTTEQLTHLFEPYHTSKKGGNGLGLMVTARIVQEHGGTISAESKVGMGTTFIVKIPRIERRVRRLSNEQA
jgi:signal transduction histidine kinase